MKLRCIPLNSSTLGFFLIAAVVLQAEPLLGPRSFTDVTGRTLNAEITALSEETIGLKRYPEGTDFQLPLIRLSEADRAFLADNHQEIVKRVTALPETEFTTLLRRDFRVLKKNLLAMEAIPSRQWAQSRYFMVIYGLKITAEGSAERTRRIGKDIATQVSGLPISVLWLGPSDNSGPNPPPIPESDFKVAQLLPPGFAVVDVAAVRRDRLSVDAELNLIATEESPANPNLFRGLIASPSRPPEPVFAVWRKRLLAQIPAYWPGCVYQFVFDPCVPAESLDGPPLQVRVEACVFDRTGHVVKVNNRPLAGYIPDVIALASLLPKDEVNAIPQPPTTPTPPAPMVANRSLGAPQASETALLGLREFTNTTGQKLMAKIKAVNLTTVTLEREADHLEVKLRRRDLSVADQVFLAENRRGLTRATAAEPGALPKRVVTGAEVIKAKRFATDVLLGTNTYITNHSDRPTLTVNAAAAAQELADFGRKTYDDFCQAAGLTDASKTGREIVLCVGNAAEIEALRQKWAPEARLYGTWTWHHQLNPKSQQYDIFLFVIDDDRNPAKSRREILQVITASFGFYTKSKEFPQSIFYPDSTAEELSDIDRQLLRCYATFIKSNDSKVQIDNAVEKNWATMVAP